MDRTIKYVSFSDVSLNDSDKIISTVDIGNYDYELLYARIALISTATPGNRLLTIQVLDPDSVEVFHTHAGSYQAASLTYHYYLLPGIFRETVSAVAETGTDGTIQVPLPKHLIIPKGYSLRLFDKEAVDAADDDLIISGMVRVIG